MAGSRRCTTKCRIHIRILDCGSCCRISRPVPRPGVAANVPLFLVVAPWQISAGTLWRAAVASESSRPLPPSPASGFACFHRPTRRPPHPSGPRPAFGTHPLGPEPAPVTPADHELYTSARHVAPRRRTSRPGIADHFGATATLLPSAEIILSARRDLSVWHARLRGREPPLDSSFAWSGIRPARPDRNLSGRAPRQLAASLLSKLLDLPTSCSQRRMRFTLFV